LARSQGQCASGWVACHRARLQNASRHSASDAAPLAHPPTGPPGPSRAGGGRQMPARWAGSPGGCWRNSAASMRPVPGRRGRPAWPLCPLLTWRRICWPALAAANSAPPNSQAEQLYRSTDPGGSPLPAARSHGGPSRWEGGGRSGAEPAPKPGRDQHALIEAPRPAPASAPAMGPCSVVTTDAIWPLADGGRWGPTSARGDLPPGQSPGACSPRPAESARSKPTRSEPAPGRRGRRCRLRRVGPGACHAHQSRER